VTGCEASYGDCNDDPDDGCETYLNNNPDHCGACDNSCDLPGATATCRQGGCELDSCDPDRANCNGDNQDGCEVDTTTDPAHCGGCGVSCAFDNADASCQTGACVMGACHPGFDDCNQEDTDGCEVETASDDEHCGSCGNACAEGESCQDGTCREPCEDADGDGHDDEACGGDDCDDDDASVHPGATEQCNQTDDDCNGQIDDSEACQDGGGGDGCGCAGQPPRPAGLLWLVGFAAILIARRRPGRPG
jgi:MYXO-CTERM domain-containing protein